MKSKTTSGFTLIELLVTISIISLLSTVVFARIYTAREGARIAKAQSFASHAAQVSGDELVARWELNEGSGSIAYDSSGNNLNGNITSGSWNTNAPTKENTSSLTLNGTNAYVEIPYNEKLQPTNALSVGLWFKVQNTNPIQKLISNTETGGYAISFGDTYCAASNFCSMIRLSGGYHAASTSLNSIKPGKWHHVFTTYDGETLKLYIDGNLVDKNENPSGPLFYSYQNNLCLGREPGAATCNAGGFLNGNISNVRIYSKSLTASKIKSIYAEEKIEKLFALK